MSVISLPFDNSKVIRISTLPKISIKCRQSRRLLVVTGVTPGHSPRGALLLAAPI